MHHDPINRAPDSICNQAGGPVWRLPTLESVTASGFVADANTEVSLTWEISKRRAPYVSLSDGLVSVLIGSS